MRSAGGHGVGDGGEEVGEETGGAFDAVEAEGSGGFLAWAGLGIDEEAAERAGRREVEDVLTGA